MYTIATLSACLDGGLAHQHCSNKVLSVNNEMLSYNIYWKNKFATKAQNPCFIKSTESILWNALRPALRPM